MRLHRIAGTDSNDTGDISARSGRLGRVETTREWDSGSWSSPTRAESMRVLVCVSACVIECTLYICAHFFFWVSAAAGHTRAPPPHMW